MKVPLQLYKNIRIKPLLLILLVPLSTHLTRNKRIMMQEESQKETPDAEFSIAMLLQLLIL